jgi:molybdenum-dependent DNA-binding transcriptional regulator ModE
MARINPEELKRFATSDRHLEVLQAVIDNGSNNKAAKALGCTRRTVDKMLKRLEGVAANQAVAQHEAKARRYDGGDERRPGRL